MQNISIDILIGLFKGNNYKKNRRGQQWIKKEKKLVDLFVTLKKPPSLWEMNHGISLL